MAACGARTTTGSRCTNSVSSAAKCAAGHPATARPNATATAERSQAAAAGTNPIPDADSAPVWTPAAEAHFDAMWNGEATGRSEAQMRESLADLEQMREDLEARRIPPRKVIGTGYKQPRQVAFEYLDSTIEQYERDLASKGRTSGVNVANVKHKFRTENLGSPTD